MSRIKTLCRVTSIFALTCSTHAFAQNAGGQPAPSASPVTLLAQATAAPPAIQSERSGDQNSVGLEEIIVVAQKRSENLQNVPLAVSVVNATQLDDASVKNVLDLSLVVPGLTVTNTNGWLSASIRGVGGNGIGAGTENSVAIYVDGVYYAAQLGSEFDFLNIDQVAVLKGPQGTLFGRNATAGVVQVTTRDPSATPTGEVSITYGNYDRVTANAYLSGGLTDNLKADIAFIGTHQGDGWGTNIYNGDQVSTVDHDIATRSKVVYTPLDGTKITLISDYSNVRTTIGSTQVILPGTLNGWLPHATPAPNLGWNSDQDGPNLHSGYAWGESLTWEQDLGLMRLLSISGYRRDQYSIDFDYDYSPLPIENLLIPQSDFQFTQELQLQSQPEQRLKWVAGFYYYDGKSGYNNFTVQALAAGLNIFVHNYETDSSYAEFAQATYDILPDTNLTLGIRNTDETRKAVDGWESLTLAASGNPAAPLTTYPDQSTSESKVTYRASLDHRFSEQFLAYVSYNTGFKSGGYNAGAPGTAPYQPEDLKAYELGVKTDLFDRRIRLNAAGYYYDYTNIQVQQLNSGATTIVNGARAKIYGSDADLTAAITNRLQFYGGVAWAHATFASYPDCLIVPPSGGVPGVVGSCAGNTIPLAPKFTSNAALDYKVDLAAHGGLDLSTNVYTNSGFPFTVDNSFNQGSYLQLGASGTWIAPGSKFRLTLFGKNLTDKRVLTEVAENTTNGAIASILAPPRTYGVTADYKFGGP